jgi:cell shape-determining protein MreC
MAKKQANRSKGMLFACGMLAGLTFLFLVPRHASGRLQLAYARAFRWPLAMTSGMVRVHTTAQVRTVSPQEHEKLLEENQQLRKGSANLQAQLQQAARQIERLTKLKAKPGLEHMQTIPAKVHTQIQDELMISQGQDSGVAVGQYVLSLTDARLDDQCVVGVVSAVYAKGARVRLITHPDSHLQVTIAGLNVSKFLDGRGDGTARISLVPTSHTIRAGDVVYAQEKRGALDVPVITAEVVQCRPDKDNPLMWDLTVRPVCELATLRDVVVLKPASAP